ncbi:RNA exonuclease 4-like [Macadamia integrifolia]|uniref:RNA exonuclease 4-like n=1 Tax=Macadamia integrifolia TaxID=60698 RepID=UPI001C4F803D|nr:RNA exonuclease 4-like [Macadamia integrifolia]XP_042516101.1 RNA exonuclease 4-like [Macadamia integrifolia]
MDSEADPPQIGSRRHKCSACYKQYKKKEHLIAHMKVSYHSIHQPKCGVCRKHCKSLESLREHVTGPLPKANCSSVFAAQGCDLCLNIFDSPEAVAAHKEVCRLSAPACLGPLRMHPMEVEMETSGLADANYTGKGPEAIAIDCEMVGGGSDGSLDICARVCLIDEGENVVLHTYVTPQIPISDYRYEITGITEAHLLDAMPLKQVQEKILDILYNGESIWRTRLEGGKARLLVGHDLEHDLDCLRMCYPEHLLRDTAKYRPLMKTNLISHSLKYLTKTYLGYKIQSGIHDPYEDCVAAMRLYKRMRDQVHQSEGITSSDATQYTHSLVNNFDSWRSKELEKMSPDALYEISRSDYRCWCLD